MSEKPIEGQAQALVEKSQTKSVQGEFIQKEEMTSFKAEERKDIPQIKTEHRGYTRLGLLVLFVTFGLFGGWAAKAPLDSAAVAPGEVIVTSNNRVVQHYEGGIVQDVLVKDGDNVEQGQVLLRLSPTQAQAELDVINGRLIELMGSEARLQAERKDKSRIVFPDALSKAKQSEQIKEVLQGQEEFFQARRKALNSELRIYRQRIDALREQINGLDSQNNTLEERIASYQAEVKDWEALFREQFADKIRLQEMQRELSRLKGEKETNGSEIARLKVQISETESEMVLRKRKFLEEVVSQLRDVQGEKADLESRKIALLDRLERVEITSPIAGTVNGLSIYTAGEVISSGQTLMEIVPSTRNYAVKAKVMPTDIDKVYVGLRADVRFSAFNTQVTKVVEGEVVYLSADKFVDERSDLEYFEARVVITPAGVKQMEDDGIFLLPGMPAETMIKIGERTLLAYFVKPFKDMFAKAFNEE
ncbi:HlyD family type I secretion periplasmic adaptor subunit [Thiosulfatimonas sediminis]|uniref:Membrane fusion protein (MFP) family protein n=1 Tax=Thiosulfatimonas sediminis TaxID=2675054 RepID=A0A6F8PSX6_9GAMM|nr:HlyD family type I secretion periplasmic adaptor subunit [Thiosulfatimonas sediminis]BBP45137.1 HlyD family type I secretion periplasmic adaptor subunit [Thiosulfatimonas sediminis]